MLRTVVIASDIVFITLLYVICWSYYQINTQLTYTFYSFPLSSPLTRGATRAFGVDENTALVVTGKEVYSVCRCREITLVFSSYKLNSLVMFWSLEKDNNFL